MLKLHFSSNSRAQGILWLLEELDLEYDLNNIKGTFANAKSTTFAQIPRYLMESLILSGIVISIIFIYNAGIDFSSYVTKSGAFILGIQKLLPLFQKTFNGLYFIRKEKLSLNSVLQLLKETKKYKNNSRDKIVNIFELKKSIRFENIKVITPERT